MAAPLTFWEGGEAVSFLVLLVLGFSAACGLCALGLSKLWILLLMVTMAGLFIGALHFRKRLALLGSAAVAIAGVFLGLGWFCLFQMFYLNHAIAVDGQTSNVTIQASDYSSATEYGGKVDGYILLDGKPYKTQVYLDDNMELEPGDEITGTLRFRVTTDDGENIATYHQGKGIFLIAYQEDEVSISYCDETPFWFLPMKLRRAVNNLLMQAFPEDTYSFAQALLLGNTENLSYETATDFKLSGIRHVIAVSGLHVSILYGMLSLITARKRILTAIVGLPVLLLFAAVAGFTPSVTRACIMVALMIIAMLFDREYDPPTALSFASMVMLMVNPLVITSAALQLSVASVAGIFLFSGPIGSWISGMLERVKFLPGKLVSRISTSVSVSLSATILTAPVSAWYFGAVSLVSVLTNLLTLWVISFVFYGIIAVCLLSLVWSAGAAVLAQLVSWPIRYVLLTADILGGLPMASVYTRSPYILA